MRGDLVTAVNEGTMKYMNKGIVFEMLMLLSKKPGPSAELRATPSGRAFVTPSLKLS